MSTINKDPRSGMNAAVAAELRAERAAQRMTIDTMAAASGYPKRSLLRWLNTERSIGVEPLFAMAGALGVPAAELVRRAEKRVASARDGRDGTAPSDAERRRSATDETSSGVSAGGATVRPLHGDDAYVEYVPSDLQAANDDGVDPELEAEGAVELP